MHRATAFLLGALLAWAGSAQAQAQHRVVTLGGSVTEIVYALGHGDRLVGDDLSSLYPEAATKLPRVGYYRATPVEGVLALKPDLVLASEQAGPPDAIKQLASAGVQVETVSDEPSVQSLHKRIGRIAQILGDEAAGRRLIESVDRDLQAAQALPASNARALLIMNRTGTPQGAGSGTAAGLVLRLAGLHNVLQDQHGYKTLSAEAFSSLAPQVLVITSTSLEASGGLDKLRAMPGIAGTPAASCIVVMDDLLALGTGPRLPQAVRQLKETDCVARQSPRRTPA
ncbi:hemin ABC transporter substrate-binding protein [Bordetella genomosp. 10]|uniref:Hemin ABC transporter substrate-binding protein n=2 Tax=Bordetella genomosp. 10 TaxID=1416804 RepID=A0A261SNH7_9BORD|nr:ABC transporter substrate-binding protein [Bordetella genomosp. 10]OZI38587.1 hemin ABC transporter substrate-binding protein [Bordetella genomosp. 10]